MSVQTTDLADADTPMTLVQVEISASDGRQIVTSDGTTISAGHYEDARWAEEYDEAIAVERWQARGKLAGVLGVSEDELDAVTMHGESDLPR